RLTLGPVVPVQPDLGRIGKVRADLDEAGTELAVQHIEVVDANPALLLREDEIHPAAGARPPGGRVDKLELLRRHDGHHPEPALPQPGPGTGGHDRACDHPSGSGPAWP